MSPSQTVRPTTTIHQSTDPAPATTIRVRRFSSSSTIISTIQLLLCLGISVVISSHLIQAASAEDRAEVNIRVSGACSPIPGELKRLAAHPTLPSSFLVYLSRRGIELSKYRPSIRFNPDKIQLVPKSPVIPGCVKIKAEGVEILKPVRNLIAEVEMRIGGSPDPNNPTLPCTKKIDDKVNQCPCAKVEGAW